MTAHGMVVEAIAETKACQPTTAAIALIGALTNIDELLVSAEAHARRVRRENP